MKKLLILAVLGTLMVSCNNETTLQEYYVENHDNQQFLSLDVPTSLLTGDNSSLDQEQRATLETIKKVNLLAFPKKNGNDQAFRQEQEKIASILQNDKYISLMRYGGGARKAELYYTGEQDAIDEFIVYGADEQRGFGVARVLGEDMKVEDLMKLVKSLEKGDIDFEGLAGFMSLQE